MQKGRSRRGQDTRRGSPKLESERKKAMKTISAWLFVLTLMQASLAVAQKAVKPLTNEDVVSMVTSVLPEEVILNAIQANDTNFDTSADALIALKNAGVSVKL